MHFYLHRYAALALACLALESSAAVEPTASSQPSFNRDVRPILSNHCFQCHGPDAQERQADLRLDIAGEIDLDEVLTRITASDADVIMPPAELNKPLDAEQIETLRQWIASGGEYQQHWAFVPPQEPEIPPVDFSKFGVGESDIARWTQHPLDRFVLAALQQANLRPSPPADKRTLIRRLSLDLTGLPPELSGVRDFAGDESDQAYTRLVDRLLDSPHYGEHMARYWLDLVRFADTNGLHHDHYREMTPYRDWIVRAFNDNLPFDEFVIGQIAGDLLDDGAGGPSTDHQIASGFNRLHLIIDRGTALPEESFMRNVVDRVSAVGTAFLGLTLECAVCHDHKYDPITQRDFYQLYAFFNNFDGEPETGGRSGNDFKRGLQPPYLELPSAEQSQQLAHYDSQIAELSAQLTLLQSAATKSADNQSAIADPASPPAQTGKTAETSEQIAKELEKVRQARERLIENIPATLVMKERSEVRPAHIMIRGNYDQPGEEVSRDTPAFLPKMQPADGLRTRFDLARWLVDSSNPLTARVAVNRIWQQIFGTGLVKTSEDFGAQGQPPSHPELLDHLTMRFVQSGWDVKALVRYIVTSQTYQQTSRASREQYQSDPGNRLLARASRYRLDAEVIRDQALAISGLLNRELYGRSVKPPQPPGLWEVVAMPNSYPRVYEADSGGKSCRRSVYSFWKRALPLPQLTIFDAPTRESCVARRERTNTPLQALVLMNEQQYVAAAIALAQRILSQTDVGEAEQIALAFESVTMQRPDPRAAEALHGALAEFRREFSGSPQRARELLAASELPEVRNISGQAECIDLAAWSMLTHSLLNLDSTKTRE